jgi:hypothetical protein
VFILFVVLLFLPSAQGAIPKKAISVPGGPIHVTSRLKYLITHGNITTKYIRVAGEYMGNGVKVLCKNVRKSGELVCEKAKNLPEVLNVIKLVYFY